MKKSFFSIVKSDLINHGGISLKKKIFIFLFNKNFKLLFSYRLQYRLRPTPLRFLNVYLKYRQRIKLGCDISVNAKIGENVRFAHAFGILIGAATIENNVTIFQQVTIGSHGVKGVEMAWPTIKEGTIIYSGAKILGKIIIGKNCTIGANCVVSRDIPDNAIIVSPIAKIIGYEINTNSDNQ